MTIFDPTENDILVRIFLSRYRAHNNLAFPTLTLEQRLVDYPENTKTKTRKIKIHGTKDLFL
jgi:hypothetical protein